MMNFKATISRGEPMPSICSICTSIYRCKGTMSEVPQENACFVDKVKEQELKGYPQETIDRLISYAPFTNSKRTVKTICDNFAHLRSAVYR